MINLESENEKLRNQVAFLNQVRELLKAELRCKQKDNCQLSKDITNLKISLNNAKNQLPGRPYVKGRGITITKPKGPKT